MNDSQHPLYRLLAQLEAAKIYFTLTRTRAAAVMILTQARHYEIEVLPAAKLRLRFIRAMARLAARI